MIGSPNFKNRDAVVVGAGISGLLAAYVLDRGGFQVTLIDQAERAGGLIQTRHTEHGISESAAHSFLATDEVREICDDLGVELVSVRPHSRARFILRSGKMRRFPLRIWEAIGALFRAYFVLSSDRASRGSATLEQWALRHLGRAPLDYLISPFLTGIYAAQPSEIAVGAAFPSLEIPQGHSLISSFIRKWRLSLGKSGSGKSRSHGERRQMVTVAGGMGALILALETRLKQRLGNRFQLGHKITALPTEANLILATPAHAAAELLKTADPHLSQELSKVRYAPLVSATIFVPKNAFAKPPRGVGVLIPAREGREALGVLFNSSAFPKRVRDEENQVSLTMMLGGTQNRKFAGRSEEDLKSVVRAELSALFALSADGAQKADILIHRWPSAIPVYDEQLIRVWRAAEQGWCAAPGHILFGNYAGQVSIRGMMQSAHALGSKLAAGLHV